MKQTNGAPSGWRTKYQMGKLRDGEHYNLRDGKIYIIVDGKYVKTNRNYKRRTK